MSSLKTYEVTFRASLMARTEVTAASMAEAEAKAKFFGDIEIALDHMDTPSHVVEPIMSDFFEAEEVDS